MEKIAVYPGSFDPITNGHVSIIERALHIFDRLIVTVAVNASKNPLFTIAERQEMIREATREYPGVMVDTFEGLLVDYVAKKKIGVIIRGLRAMSDYESELQMTLMNRKLNRSVETIFMITGLQWFYVSSRLIKEVAAAGGSLKGLVPDVVCARLNEKFMSSRRRKAGRD
jgi:pantetheine-phosphate adenylyltransferase